MVQVGAEPASVVEQVQLAAQQLGVGGARLAGQTGEQPAKLAPVVIGRLLNSAAVRGFCTRRDKAQPRKLGSANS